MGTAGAAVIFRETPVKGVLLVEPELREDDRGFFARTWCKREAETLGLNPAVAQCSISFTRRAGTVRGMHYQAPPDAETKLVRCTRGSVYDVVIDLRPNSPTFLQHHGITLTAENRLALYVPEGVAHGFQTLENDTEVLYQISVFHAPGSARGVRWDDSMFGIQWPLAVTVIAERDRMFPDFEPPQPRVAG